MENKGHIKAIINRTFEVIQKVYKCQKETDNGIVKQSEPLSFIIFPKRDNNEIRISEQELRFIFVEQLNKEIREGWNVFYSIETPTKDIYRFSDVETPLCGEEIKIENEKRKDTGEALLDGESANFDLVIHDDNFNRIALIEFKANNASKSDHAKDFKKLTNPKETEYNDIVLKYFIEIVKNTNSGTFSNLHEKIEGNEDIFRCCSLSNGDITKEVISAPIKK